jgi:hypothetical protein
VFGEQSRPQVRHCAEHFDERELALPCGRALYRGLLFSHLRGSASYLGLSIRLSARH